MLSSKVEQLTNLPYDVYVDVSDSKPVTEGDLPNGLHPVFIQEIIARGEGKKYTHSAVSIAYIINLGTINEEIVQGMINKGMIGCLKVENHRVSYLLFLLKTVQKFQEIGINEIMLKIGKEFKNFQSPIYPQLMPLNDYQKLCACILPSLKKRNLISNSQQL